MFIDKSNSVSDFAIANIQFLELVHDLELLQIESECDHFPLLLQLDAPNTYNAPKSTIRGNRFSKTQYIWNRETRNSFKDAIRNSPKICAHFSYLSVDGSTQAFKNLLKVRKLLKADSPNLTIKLCKENPTLA